MADGTRHNEAIVSLDAGGLLRTYTVNYVEQILAIPLKDLNLAFQLYQRKMSALSNYQSVYFF